MKLSQLKLWFDEFNNKHFGGVLRPIPIRITRSKRYYGQHFSDPPSIYIGKHLNRTPEDFRDTLVHEMIHQYLDQLGIVEQDDHGPIFQKEYLRICGKNYSEP